MEGPGLLWVRKVGSGPLGRDSEVGMPFRYGPLGATPLGEASPEMGGAARGKRPNCEHVGKVDYNFQLQAEPVSGHKT